MRRDDDDDRAGGQSWIDHVVIPDDISSLDAEVRALRRERRARARRDRLRRMVSPRGVAGPLVIVVLLLVAGFASLLVLFQPRRTTTPPAPLATSGTGSGRDGSKLLGLLPDLPVTQADGRSRRLREFRPAVIALAPVGCGCDAALQKAGSAVVANGLQFVLVDQTLPARPAGLAEADTVRLIEPTGKLAATYPAGESPGRSPGVPVLVLVRVDGQVTRVVREPLAPTTFKTELDNLSIPHGIASPTG